MWLYIYAIILFLPFLIFRPRDVFQPEFAVNAYFVIFIGIGPLVMSAIFPEKYAQDSFVVVTELLLAGYVSMNVGYLISRRMFGYTEHCKFARSAMNGFKGDTRPYFLLAVVLMFIAFVAMSLYFVRAGQIPMLQVDRAIARVDALNIQGNGYLMYLGTLGMIGVLLYSVAVYAKHHNRRREIGLVVMMLIVGVVLISTGSRRYFMWTLLYFVMVRHYLFRQLSYRDMSIIGVVGLLMINAFEVFRDSDSETTSSLYTAALYRSVVYLNNFNAAFNAFVDSGLMYGSTLYMDVLTLLPGKQIDYQSWIKETTGFQFYGFGMPPTFMGDMYINFGLLGVVVGGVLYGMLVRHFYRAMIVRYTVFSLIVYVLSFEIAIKALTSGISSQAISVIWILLIILLIKIWNHMFRHGFTAQNSRQAEYLER